VAVTLAAFGLVNLGARLLRRKASNKLRQELEDLESKAREKRDKGLPSEEDIELEEVTPSSPSTSEEHVNGKDSTEEFKAPQFGVKVMGDGIVASSITNRSPFYNT